MTLELWNTFGTFGTFVVIAATAIAALVQLRHARGSNQIAAMGELKREFEAPGFRAAQHFVQTQLAEKVKDPEFRYQIINRRARTRENQAFNADMNAVGNYYENLGLMVKRGLVDRDLTINMWSYTGSNAWEDLAPVTALARRVDGDSVWENFEYFVVAAREWIGEHPVGDFPSGVQRIALKDEWLEADRQYEASRAPA